MEIENDAQLIQRILSGDDSAFNTLVQKYQKGVHALAWRKIGDFHYAEEITQDTFLQAYKNLSTLSNPDQFAGWLYVIATRLCIDWQRKQKFVPQSLQEVSVKEVEESTYARYISEKQETASREHRYEIVEKILKRLPESERTVVTLHYLGEMTAKEIGKFLGVSVGTIDSRLHRARERLKNSEELLVQEVLKGVHLSANVSQNIMREVADLKPTPDPAQSPLLPWAALGAAAVFIALLLGGSNQYLTRFQPLYSFEAESQPTIEIIDVPPVLELDAKPAVRNQAGQVGATDKKDSTGSQVSEQVSTSNALASPEDVETWMPDPNLRAAVREALRIPDDDPLTQLDMERLTALSAEERQITSLGGLEYATNLTSALLEGNPISNLSPLAGLVQLRMLNMAGCQISDIRPLANLTRLESLRLHANQIEDITPLTNLTRLTDLWLATNHIADVRPLEKLTLLEELRIHRNLIADYSPLGTLSLVNFQYDESYESPGLPIQARLQNQSSPSIFNAWGRISNRPALSYEARLAYHDLSWSPEFGLRFQRTAHGFQLAGSLDETRKRRDALIKINPDKIFILEIRMRGAAPDSPFYKVTYTDDFPWIRDAAGDMVSGSDLHREFLIDFTHPDAQDIIVQQALAVKKCGLYDGIYIDWWNEDMPVLNGYRTLKAEQQARSVILERIRTEVGDDFLIIVNSGRSKPIQAAPYINGLFIQTDRDHARGYSYEGLMDIESTLSWAEKNLRSPQVNCLKGRGVETEVPDSATNRRWMRVFTTMGLTHSDGYILYTTGIKYFIHKHDWRTFEIRHKAEHERGIKHTHHNDIYWYDFWDAPLGKPIGEKAHLYKNRKGLFIRQFTNGWAIYNRSGKEQSIQLPASATGVASRTSGTSHTVPDLDGEIYLK